MGYKVNDEVIEEFLKMYLEGERIVDIAEELGVGKSTLYALLKDENVIKELERNRMFLQNQTRAMLMKDAKKYIANIKEIADESTDVRSKLKANETLLAYIIGKPTDNINVETNDNDKDNNSFALEELYNSNEDDEEDNNVIKLAK